MFATPPLRPITTAPASPCLGCLHGTHSDVCDPIAKAMGAWARAQEAKTAAKQEELKTKLVDPIE